MNQSNYFSTQGLNIEPFVGISIPAEVIRQLKLMLDIPLERIPSGALHAAHMSFIDDAEVVEEPDGSHIFDMLDPEEEADIDKRFKRREIYEGITFN